MNTPESENIENPVSKNPEGVRKKRPWWKRIIRIFFWVSGVFIFLLVTLIVLTYVYRDEVKGYVISEVNKRVNTTIIVDPKNIDITLISSFPDVSVDFKNISALDATAAEKRDTLLKAGKVSLAFNIMDLWRANYTIHNITVEDANVKVWVDGKGNDNYHFIKTTSDSGKTDTSHVDFALEKIILKNVTASYSDKRKKNSYQLDFQKLKFTGEFGKENFDFGTDADFTVGKIVNNGHSYFKGNHGSLDLDMQIDNSTGTFTIKKAKLKIADFGLLVSGNVTKRNSNYLLNLAVKGDDINLPSALSLLPPKYHNDLTGLESTGEFYVDATIKGLASDSIIPELNVQFGINDGATIERKNGSVKLTDIALKGSFSNAKGKEGLQISSFKASSAKSKFVGTFTMSGFEHPHYSTNISGNVDVEEMQNVLQIDTIESASGKLDIQMSASGSPSKGSSLSVSDFRQFNTSGVANFNGVTLRLKGTRFPTDSIYGKLSFDGNNVTVEGFTARAAGSDVRVDGTVKNLLGYLFTEKEVLNISGNLSSRNLNLNTLLTAKNPTTTKKSSEPAYRLVLPDRLNLTLNSDFDHVIFQKFEARNVIGNVTLSKRRLTADPISFHSMDGSFSGSGMIDGARIDSLLITCNADLENVNIYKLFYQTDNFGQGDTTTITYRNVSGTLNSHIDFASVWGNDLSVNENKIYTNADLSIANGELKDFKPLFHLSHFVKLDELKDI